MKLERGPRIGLGILLIVFSIVSIFSTIDERILGRWAGDVMGFQFFAFGLMFWGLWLVLRDWLKGAK